ncbi:MAG: 50S ribosomal protein L25 [candidate division WOR-3 bacterium]|nr:50S ribosomal protein L25 [candidate division WOR-3 bacterium]MCX7757526.1 50S ribosomal protein L25 [candidate division WOR-3 bacterium]MDW7987183.1 50S ribosomal protein L25 [candidate division WOR-3 bacterium]
MENTIKAYKRTWIGTSACKKFRKQGIIPAVVYGHGDEAINLAVNEKEFEKFLDEIKGRNPVVDLIIDNGEVIKAVIKSIQREAMTRRLLAIDFQKIHREEKIVMHVPVVLKGTAIGIKAGGILDHHLRTIPIRGFADQLPDHIEIDVSNLKLGQTIHISDLKYENIEFVLPPETPIVSVLIPKKVAEAATVVEEIKEPEVITEKKHETKEVDEEAEKTTTDEDKKK